MPTPRTGRPTHPAIRTAALDLAGPISELVAAAAAQIAPAVREDLTAAAAEAGTSEKRPRPELHRLALGAGDDDLVQDLVAAAIADELADKVLREELARTSIVRAQAARPRAVLALRAAVGYLVGITRQGVERRYGLLAGDRMGERQEAAEELAARLG